MARGDTTRTARVAELVRIKVASALTTAFSDPRLQGIVVTRVEVTADLQIARVFVRTSDSHDEQAREQMMRGLKAASPRLRRMVAQALDLRRAPELRFQFDSGIDAADRIEELLRDIKSGR